jgi:hypothetical protein
MQRGRPKERRSLKEQEEECENKSKWKYPRGSKPKGSRTNLSL